ncbi:Histone demethylase JHD2 [Spathaspora sp. JA1]|nr:Histone demethylase JHD2 [Spathaspora sp. JA1]
MTDAKHSFKKELLKPCPVLNPTEHEFNDPIGYLSSEPIAKLGALYGIVKIVPPPTWKPPFNISPDFKFHVRKQKISDLGLTSRSRMFFRESINRFLKMRRKKQLRLSFKVEGVPIYYYDIFLEVEKLGGSAKMTKDKWRYINEKMNVDPLSTSIEHEYVTSIRYYALYLNNKTDFEFPESDEEDEFDNCLICGKHDNPEQTLLCDNCDNPYHMKCLPNPLNSIPATNWYCDKCLIGTGEYGFEEDRDVKYTLREFYELCRDFDAKFADRYNNNQPLTVDIIEDKFWSFVENEKADFSVKYGADIHHSKPGEISGFPMKNTPGIDLGDPIINQYIKHPFNLTRLPFAKGSLLNYVNTSISGMTVPWIYIGSLLSTFCWHVEDHYTLSANYCHFGATKKWYGIPAVLADKFERVMRNSAPDLFQKQPDLLHQLVTLMSPTKLVENGVAVTYADQNPGEFIITYPRVYHAGFNCGFNFNEAVNFTMNGWLEYGEKSIADYKLIKKENVFNHYELLENVLRSFNKQTGKISRGQMDFLKRCLASFESFVVDEEYLLKNIDQTKFTCTYEPKYLKETNEPGSSQDDVEEIEDDFTCDSCKTHLSYQFCVLKYKSADVKGVKSDTSQQEEKHVTRTDAKPSETEQLLTPGTSPWEQKRTSVKPEVIQLAANSEASQQLSSIGQKRMAEMDTYDILIEDAKRQAREYAGNYESERKSKRLESVPRKSLNEDMLEKENAEKVVELESKRKRKQRYPAHSMRMTKPMKSHQERKEIRLCLACTKKLYGVTGTDKSVDATLVYRAYPSQLKDLIKLTKRNISELSGF